MAKKPYTGREMDKLRAQVKDLKARLREVAALTDSLLCDEGGWRAWPKLDRVINLRVKNWRAKK
jgi:hypothetical protein